MKKRLILLSISAFLLLGLVYLSGIGEVFEALTAANPYYIGLGVVFWCINIFFRCTRWRYLLSSLDIDIGYAKLFRYYTSGLFLSNLSPAKTGEPIRAVFLKKLEAESFTSSMGTIIIEKMMDVISMSVIAVLGLLFLMRGNFLGWVYFSIAVYGLVIAFMLYIIFSGDKLEGFLGKLISLLSFIKPVAKLEDKVVEFSENIRETLSKFKSKKILFNTFLLSFPLWIMEGLIFWTAFRAIGYNVSYPFLVVVSVTALLVSVLTFLPGALGSNEVIRVGLLTPFLSIAVSDITTAVLLTVFMSYFITALVGFIFLSTLPKDLLDIDIF